MDQQCRSYDFEIKGAKVFATCNEINRRPKPLQSRFRRLHLPSYTKEQFLDIAVKVCPKLKVDISRIIGHEVWKTSKDVRDVISLSKLIRKSDGPDEIEAIMRTFTKYAARTLSQEYHGLTTSVSHRYKSRKGALSRGIVSTIY